jgi:hypothetical protein
MTVATMTEPLLLELDDKTWGQFLDRSATWLGNVQTTQAKFRALAEATADKVGEPHVKQYLHEIADKAREHERSVEELYPLIGRGPAPGRSVLGSVLSKGSELAADLIGWMGGAASPWGDLRQLLLANQDALGAFAIAEQLGYALGLPELAERCFRIVREKHTHQLLIEEYMLEVGAAALLYNRAGGATGHDAPGLTDRVTETRLFQRGGGTRAHRRHTAGSGVPAIAAAVGVAFVAAVLWGSLRGDHAD